MFKTSKFHLWQDLTIFNHFQLTISFRIICFPKLPLSDQSIAAILEFN